MKTKICSTCREELPISKFSYRNKKLKKLSYNCMKCNSEYGRKHYASNKEKYETKKKDRLHRLREEFLSAYPDLKCKMCGENEQVCLDFHHKDPTEKETTISRARAHGWSMERLQKEIDKCEVLCSNCHRKFHAGLINL